jgi:hypothetical protein
LKTLGVGGRIMLKYILNKLKERALTGLIWLRIEHVADSCEYGNEYSDSIKLEIS